LTAPAASATDPAAKVPDTFLKTASGGTVRAEAYKENDVRLKFLALSDTHLGEDCSLLSFPHGRHHLWKTLREHFGQNADDQFDVDELILLGDTTDRTLSSTSQIITHANAFIQTLGSAAHIKKGVFLPGNHEHTLWTSYHRQRDAGRAAASVTGPEGEFIVRASRRVDKNQCGEELLTIFFGYPSGSTWRAIAEEKRDDQKLDFVVANPVYAKRTSKATYVFMHGAHFCSVVCEGRWWLRVADMLQFDRLLAGLEIASGIDVTRARNLEDLERIVSPFMDSLWPSSGNNPTSRSDQLWFLCCSIQGKLQRGDERRASPSRSRRFTWSDLRKDQGKRVRQLTEDSGRALDGSVKRWDMYCRDHVLEYLQRNQLPTDNVVLVYGDTHDGGWGQQPPEAGSNVRLYNTGGWVVLGPKDHPACHLFAVGEDDEEYLLDVSFKDVSVGGEPLLELAALDLEHRLNRIGRTTRAAAALFSR
jgi:hypothetical protein